MEVDSVNNKSKSQEKTEKMMTVSISIPFPSEYEAGVAYGSLNVDKEPKRGGCQKVLRVMDHKLVVDFSAAQAKTLRVGVNSFLDLLILVIETMEKFGPPAKT